MNEAAKEKTLAEKAPASYECRACGYIYEPAKGDGKAKIPPGTLFTDLPKSWRCPVCGVAKGGFANIGSPNAPSGFE
mgnify:CR=1 FL=1